LAGKVARRSSGRLAGVDDLIGRTDELRRRATELAGADAVAVHAMVTSADMPEAARAVPEEIRDLAAELAQVAARLAAHGNPALHADAVGASRLAEAARAAAEAIAASSSPGGGWPGGRGSCARLVPVSHPRRDLIGRRHHPRCHLGQSLQTEPLGGPG